MSLRVNFRHGAMNGHMQADWYVNGKWTATTPRSNKTHDWLEFPDVWPISLTIVLKGKNPLTDTRVYNGEIVADKHMAIVGMELGRYPVASAVIERICEFCPHGEPRINQAYFHRDGEVMVTFAEKDILTWHLKHNTIHIP